MKSLILTSVLLISLTKRNCKKDNASALPSCIQSKIEAIKAQPKWNPSATVDEYQYNGKRVFLFSSDCCDRYNELVDEQCNYICAPSGGYTGKGDGKCSDFKDKATFVKQVWKDPR